MYYGLLLIFLWLMVDGLRLMVYGLGFYGLMLIAYELLPITYGV